MEDVPTTSSCLRNSEAGNGNSDDTSNLIQHVNIPEPAELYFGVCTRPLSELTRTTVSQMRANESAIGFYLLLRTLAPTVVGTGQSDFGRNVLVLVEDHVKKQIFCCLYGHVHLSSEPELQELLPVDAVFALKEPFLVACSEQQFVIVVGGPSDFVVVGRSHVLYKDAEALGWREKTEDEGMQLIWKWTSIGHKLLQKRKFYDATEAFLFALKNCSEASTKLILHQNLATSFLVEQRYESAIKHSMEVLEIESLNESALHCAGRAQYELREYRKARICFDTLYREIPTNTNYLSQLVRCEKRLREAEGKVDIFKLYEACLTDVTEPIDQGTYLRNIDFRPGSDNVRGVFAAKDMEPGTLILVEKSLVTIFKPSCSPESGVPDLMRTAFRAAFKNPKTLGRKLRSLPGGRCATADNRRMFCDEVNELEPVVFVRCLYLTIHTNMIKDKNRMVENGPIAYLVFEAATRFRHSCLSNCSLLVYKDVAVVRTCTSVLKGEELFLRFYGNRLSFPEKQEAFERRGITCSCVLCALDKMEAPTVHVLRQQLMTRFDAEMALGSAEEKLLPIVHELELTYRYRDSLRVLLFIVYRDLARVVNRCRENWADTVTFYVERGLNSVGLSTTFLLSCVEQVNPQIPRFHLMPEVLLDCAELMAEKERCSGRLDLVQKWVKVILLLERIYR